MAKIGDYYFGPSQREDRRRKIDSHKLAVEYWKSQNKKTSSKKSVRELKSWKLALNKLRKSKIPKETYKFGKKIK